MRQIDPDQAYLWPAHRAAFLFSGSVTAFIDNAQVPGADLHAHWWDFISYVPQGSMSVLNPVMRIEDQMLDGIPRRHQVRGRAALRREIVAFLRRDRARCRCVAGLSTPVIGRDAASACSSRWPRFFNPRVILADEPTTALDVIMQKRILVLILGLQRRMRNALVIVSHDLGVHYQLTTRIAIAYAGELIEIGPTAAMFAAPLHPYTEALVGALPRVGDEGRRHGLDGRPPSLLDPPPGCRFHPRCPEAQDVCRRLAPPLEEKSAGRFAACHFR